jgi:hypothetical protein
MVVGVCLRRVSASYTRKPVYPRGGFMRTIVLLPITALVAIAAGCGSDIKEERAHSVSQRDLTRVAPAAQLEIASPVEIQRPQIRRRTVRPARTVPAPQSTTELPVKVVDLWVPAPARAAAQPVALPAGSAATPTSDRELPPGKTVTLIPASSGPSLQSDGADEPPATRAGTMVARGGGRCRGGGRGPGVSAPRPDFR